MRKERPILFQGAMVRALLDGSKTQTRRVVKGQTPEWDHVIDEEDINGHEFFMVSGAKQSNGLSPILDGIMCPYGQPGDRLWVRETWIPDPVDDGTWAYTQWAGSKGSPLSDIPKRFQKPEHCIHRASWDGHDMVWKPSIHMPRWASRILLEIVSVRVERLRDISEADALAEGIKSRNVVPGNAVFGTTSVFGVGADSDYAATAKSAYCDLWESINGAGSWDANPFVWVVEFKRISV